MSTDLRDLFKKELDQIPLRPAETWVPQSDRSGPGRSAWRLPVALATVAVVLIAALVGGRELASFRDRTSAAGPGTIAGKAIYLSPSFNGSGWIQIDPLTLRDLSARPLMDIAATSVNSFETTVSPDGSTIFVGDYTHTPTFTMYDARTGSQRGLFTPEIRITGPEYLSADGRRAMARLATTQGEPMSGEKAIVSVPDGRLIRRVSAVNICCIQAVPVAPDLSAIYFVSTPKEIGLIPASPLGLLPYSLTVQNTTTGALSAPVLLPGITGGVILSFGSPTVASTPVTLRPAVALSEDGRTLAALSFDGQTLDLVDTATLAVTTVSVHRKASWLDLLGPQIAAAKTLNDEERHSMVFTPDGQAVLTFTTRTHYDDLNGVIRTTRDIQRIEIASGLLTATSEAPEAIFSFRVTPDGDGVLVVARTQETPAPRYVLRRLDARTLAITAERQLPDYAEIQIVAARAP